MKKVVEYGIDGMECFPPVHHPETGSQEYLTFAHEHNLIATSGSDYHGNYSLLEQSVGTKSPEVLPGDNIFPVAEKEATIEYFKKHHIL